MISSHTCFPIQAIEQLPFSADAYSQFKFGDVGIAEAFGQQLAQSFILEKGSSLLQYEKIVLVPSPYDYIPTASYFLTKAFGDELNGFLFSQDRKSVIHSKIHRNKTYSEDYGALNGEERRKLIANDTYHLDTRLMDGALCIFVDDIKITGSHEWIIRRLLEQEPLQADFLFAYFAELQNPAVHPRFENYLNYHAIKGIPDIIALAQKSCFRFNTRVIKYILQSDRQLFQLCVDALTPLQRKELFYLAIGNSYHTMPAYAESVSLLSEQLELSIPRAEKTAALGRGINQLFLQPK